MLFNIEHDSGERVVGYIVPESFSEIPEIDVVAGGAVVLSMPVNEIREALVGAGRHETGQCGFNIGPEHLPDIVELHDLRIVEKGSGVTIYRRPMPIQIHRRVIRFETSLYPLWRMDNAIGHQFQYFEKGLERFGRETVTQMFLLNHYSSILLSGRIAYKNFSMYIEENFDGLCLIQNPHEERAERLLGLARMSEIGAQHLGERDAMRLAPAIAFAASLDFEDEKKLKKAMLAMPMDVAQLLANPLVRQFTTTTPDEMPSGNAVASTLDILAHFAVVGTRDFAHEYTEAVGAMLGTDPSVIPQIWTFEKVRAAGELIRRIRVVDHLIEKDLAVYAQVHRALAELARSV